MRSWRKERRRGVSQIIAVVLLLGITIGAGTLLWYFQPKLPAQPVGIQYVALGDQSEPAWGDPTDCSNRTVNAACNTLPAFFIVVTSHTPAALPLTAISLELQCNGTSLVNGTLKALEIVPGTGSSPANNSPLLGHCGTWFPSSYGHDATFFNRLLYFQQLYPGYTTLQDGDQVVVYIHPALDFRDWHNNTPDDDYHGAPPWCFSIVNACQLILTYTQNPPALIATIPIVSLAGTNTEV